ncbi:Phosphotransferase [Thalictrum thalictroides]|uniref:Phosphotransferase n=1 Tax=Thalictrum thalictroides TaxID=46969 RepID=A0A7J6VJ84_THATH|nr:Phosphotransferase [Thalictrum thalictroides]
MDGGLYEHYPQYRKYLQDAVDELLGSEISKNVIIEHSKDGSGIGAALLAAANSKYASKPLTDRHYEALELRDGGSDYSVCSVFRM